MMSEHNFFRVYDIEESGARNRLKIEPQELRYYLHPEKALVIIKEDVRRIYFWKGAKAPVRKRFLGSRAATAIQGDLMKEGCHRCKIISIDQGEELDEFLNQFGLVSMEVTERLEDMHYIRNQEREEMKLEELRSTKQTFSEPSKLDEIKKLLDVGENMLWIKSHTIELTKNWLKTMLKDKRYKDRIKNLAKADEIEIDTYENRYVITNKRIIVNSKLNTLYDFSGIPENIFKIEGEVASLDISGLNSFEIEENKGYDVWINAETLKKGTGVFLFENLTLEEYNNFLDVFTTKIPYRAEVPKNIRLKYIPKKKI